MPAMKLKLKKKIKRFREIKKFGNCHAVSFPFASVHFQKFNVGLG
jgi:hypothetical protein